MNPAVGKRSITHLITRIRTPQPLKHEESKLIILSTLSLCKLGRLNEALRSLPADPFTVPSSTYASLLQLCIDHNAKDEGISLQNHLLAHGYAPPLHLDTKFIVFHSKIGDLAAARRIFDEMPERSVVSWTSMISGYSHNGHFEEALKLFSLMRGSGFTPNQFTYGSTLKACTGMGWIGFGQQVHGCIEKSRFGENLFVQSALVDLHLKHGSMVDARCLFGRMETRDAVSWNSLIGGYVARGLGDDASALFCSMLRDGLLPDHFTFASVLRACGSIRALLSVSQIHAFVTKFGYEGDCVVTGSLIDAYAKCKRMHSARQLYDSVLKPDLISCTALVTGYSLETDCNREALELFHGINRMNMRVDNVMLCSMLNVCANIASLSLGRQIHARAIKNPTDHDVALGNAVIDMYSKSGELQDAHRAFDEMQEKNVISWTSLITGFGKHGYGESAIAFFLKMERDGVEPNDVTFLSLLFACSHSGLTGKGMDFFNAMVNKYGIQPRAEHYSCVVDLLARGGLLKEAYEFVCKMNVTPNTSLWGAILGACRMHGDLSLGKAAAGYLCSLDPKRSVNYVVLANIYAAAGCWEDAWKTRKLMERMSTTKDAGCSLIE